ncbi:MAG: chemotaxis protein CheW [Candidatus Coatesbacteria bacterium]|nr:chemotaxis protein CheW [Candidatus Coatesbacteria bacterium]
MNGEEDSSKILTSERKPTRVHLLIFQVGGINFALILQESAYIKSIFHGVTPYEPTVKVPNTPEYIKGLTNYKGKLVLVVDLGKVLKIPIKKSRENKFILLEIEDELRAFLVDDVTDTDWVDDISIEMQTYYSIAGMSIPFVAATVMVKNRILPIIDPNLIFASTPKENEENSSFSELSDKI